MGRYSIDLIPTLLVVAAATAFVLSMVWGVVARETSRRRRHGRVSFSARPRSEIDIPTLAVRPCECGVAPASRRYPGVGDRCRPCMARLYVRMFPGPQNAVNGGERDGR